MRKLFIPTILVLTAIALPLSTSSLSWAADSCQPAIDAINKVATMPRHTYTTHTASYTHGQARTSETVVANGKVYVRVNGKWRLGLVTAQEMLEQQKQNQEKAKATCQFLRSEVVGTEPAAVYSIHSESEDGQEDSQMWISKSSGLPLREDQDMDLGGRAGKEHRSTRFEYGNIRPPM